MRILVFSTDYPPTTGGMARYSHEIARHFHLGGDEVAVLSTRQTGDSDFDAQQPFTTYRATLFPLREIPLLFLLHRIIKKRNIDCIFCITWFPCGALCYLHSVLSTNNTPYIVAVQGSDFFSSSFSLKLKIKGKLSWLRKQTLLNALAVCPNSVYTKNKIVEMGFPETKMTVVHPGVDTSIFKPVPPSKTWKNTYPLGGKKIILTVARLDAHKGVDNVIKALPRVQKAAPDFAYLVAGAGPEENHLKTLAAQLNVSDSVFFLGPVPSDEKLVALYSLCDVFIMPSRELPGRPDLIEGFGISFIEANACGKPAIGGRSGGVPDAVENGISGLLVNPESADDIAEALIRLLTQGDFAETLGEKGRRRAEEQFTWTHATKKIKAIMEAK